MQSLCLCYIQYRIADSTADEKQVVITKVILFQKCVQARNVKTDKWNDVMFQRNVSKILVPVEWTAKNGNWKFPFQLPGLSNLIVISVTLQSGSTSF